MKLLCVRHVGLHKTRIAGALHYSPVQWLAPVMDCCAARERHWFSGRRGCALERRTPNPQRKSPKPPTWTSRRSMPRKINSLHLEPSGAPLLATSCSDGSVGVWDIRMLERGVAGVVAAAKAGGSGGSIGAKTKPLSLLQHAKSCHAAYWAPNGSKVRMAEVGS